MLRSLLCACPGRCSRGRRPLGHRAPFRLGPSTVPSTVSRQRPARSGSPRTSGSELQRGAGRLSPTEQTWGRPSLRHKGCREWGGNSTDWPTTLPPLGSQMHRQHLWGHPRPRKASINTRTSRAVPRGEAPPTVQQPSRRVSTSSQSSSPGLSRSRLVSSRSQHSEEYGVLEIPQSPGQPPTERE